MNRNEIPKSEAYEFGAEEWIMQSTSEEQNMATRFPNPLPSTHRMTYEWASNERGQNLLRFVVMPKPENARSGDDVVPVGTDDRRKELSKLDLNELKTLAAVASVELPARYGKAQLVGMLLAAEAK